MGITTLPPSTSEPGPPTHTTMHVAMAFIMWYSQPHDWHDSLVGCHATLPLLRNRHDIRLLCYPPAAQAYMTSSTKLQVHYVLNSYHKRTEPWPQLTCTENFVKFGHVVFEICSHRDIQTDRHGNHTTSHPYMGGRSNEQSWKCKF